ncbi:hypothetical protein PEDI_25210 [Persicobacter diffluens]|uniref:Uncharacterized protein n=2 Tax=Persicobacter diffluens TaxID=981 RepID=A0AAN4VZA3_9BACT|nr:hypothetical protein PEDI_25210 [Persicobacter diffluens]
MGAGETPFGLVNLYLSLGYKIINNKHYQMIPAVGFGTYWDYDVSERKSSQRTSQHRLVKVALNNRFKGNKINYFIKAYYMRNAFNNSANYRNSWNNFGLEVGIDI